MAKKIEQLSQEQLAAIPAFRDEWLNVGLRTGEADLAKIRPLIEDIYRQAKLEPPAFFIRCASPYWAQIAMNLLKVRAQVWDQVWDQVGAQVRAQVGDQVWAQVGAQVRAQVEAQVWDQVRAQVRAQVGDQVWAQVGAQVGAQVEAQVWDQVRAQVWAQVGDQVRAQVEAQVWDQVEAQVRAQKLEYFGTSLWGSGESYWIAYAMFFQRYLKPDFYTEELREHLAQWETISKNSFWWYPFENFCFVCDRPTSISFDDQQRLHCSDQAAIGFSDGWGVYCWHGVRVPAHIITNPQQISVEEIETQPNAEIRRVMMDRYGLNRYLLDSGAQEIHRDNYGVLYRKDIPGDEPLVMVEVINSTPERDGSFKSYFLRVPPTMCTAHAAVAWTFEMTPEQYRPAFES